MPCGTACESLLGGGEREGEHATVRRGLTSGISKRRDFSRRVIDLTSFGVCILC